MFSMPMVLQRRNEGRHEIEQFFFLTSIKIFFRVISESKLRYIREMRVNAPVSTGVPSLTLRDAPVNS